MAKPGRKLKAKVLHLQTGTDRKDRQQVESVIPLHGEVRCPKWLTGAALKLFEERVVIYEKRGQSVVGLEKALAHYCRLEILLISLWKTPAGPTMAMLSEYRRTCSDFFDTPASQLARPGNKPDNPFSKHKR